MMTCQTPPPPPPPPSPPVLRRQNATCISCGTGHFCNEPCVLFPDSLGPSSDTLFYLPPPPPVIRNSQLQSSFTSVISPIADIWTPRNISDAVSIEEYSMREERALVYHLTRMLETYNHLEERIQTEEENSRSHDEMMTYQMCWDDMDKKRSAVEDLLNILKS